MVTRQTALVGLAVCILLFFFGTTLSPLQEGMFAFHDETQAARLQEFTLSLKSLKIPPRMAPHFSYGLGYPVFNFYAPFSYFLTSALSVVFNGDILTSLKASFLLALIVSYVATYLLLRQYFSSLSSLLGAFMTSSSLYMAVEVFVRGNLAEVWFIALFPLYLYLIKRSSRGEVKNTRFITLVIVGSFLLTTHNLLSLLSIPLVLVFILLHPQKKLHLVSFALSILLSSYFLVPLFLESHLTYAREVASRTPYDRHFLCLRQLWNSPWGFAGSAPGCTTDGMSFQLGKVQILLSLLGIGLWGVSRARGRKDGAQWHTQYFVALTAGSLFLTTNASRALWDMARNFSSVIQFPWRFITFSLVGISYLSALAVETFKKRARIVLLVVGVMTSIFLNSKFFTNELLPTSTYVGRYLSAEYILFTVAYKIPEYLPKTANYQLWQNYKPSKSDKLAILAGSVASPQRGLVVKKNTPFEKELQTTRGGEFTLNLHYFPYWKIVIDDADFMPQKFDFLGRPILALNHLSSIKITYRQTTVEKIGNFLSVITLIITFLACFNSHLWKKTKIYLR